MKIKPMIGIVLCGVLIAFSTAFADTEVEGEVSGVWTLEGSPYIVLDSTWVPEGEELTITRGVTVQFASETGLYIYGMLAAIGAEEDSIHFTTNQEGEEWAGIYFYQREEEYNFEYCTIRNALNGLVASGQTYLRIINCDINCSYIAFGVLNSNDVGQTNNQYFIESSIIVGGRVTPFNSSILTAFDSYFATGSGEQWGFINRGSVELTGCDFLGTFNLSGYSSLRSCNFYHVDGARRGVRVSGLIQDCYVDNSVSLINSNTEVSGNTVTGSMGLQFYLGLVTNNIVGSLTLRDCRNPVTVTNCIISTNITVDNCTDVEVYDCHILGQNQENDYTVYAIGFADDDVNSYLSFHHNLLLGKVRAILELNLDFKNNTVIVESTDRPVLQLFLRCDSINITNNIIICEGENSGLIYPSQAALRVLNFKYNCMYGFDQFHYSIYNPDIELDESNLFDVDPLLVSLDPLDPLLTADSPCIDAGDPDSPLDPDSTRADMGAFYFPHEVGVLERRIIQLPHTTLLSVYPNPFNSTVRFRYSLPYSHHVRLQLYDISGRLVETLIDERLQAGRFSTV